MKQLLRWAADPGSSVQALFGQLPYPYFSMKQIYLIGLLAGLLSLPGAAHAQATERTASAAESPAQLGALGYPSPPIGAAERAVLGGPPQVPYPPAAADTAGSGTAPSLAQLQQLHLPALLADQPSFTAARGAAISVQEVARVFPQAVRQQPGFLPDVSALATATAAAGSRSLVVLALPASAAGVPGGGAAVGQRLQVRGPAGKMVVTVVRPAAAGSRTLIVRGEPGLIGQPVFVVGLEHSAVQAIDYETLALLGLRAAQELAGQLAAGRQQLAGLRRQLAAARRVNGALLLDHAELQELKQQLNRLQMQQAASFSAAHRHPIIVWPVD